MYTTFVCRPLRSRSHGVSRTFSSFVSVFLSSSFLFPHYVLLFHLLPSVLSRSPPESRALRRNGHQRAHTLTHSWLRLCWILRSSRQTPPRYLPPLKRSETLWQHARAKKEININYLSFVTLACRQAQKQNDCFGYAAVVLCEKHILTHILKYLLLFFLWLTGSRYIVVKRRTLINIFPRYTRVLKKKGEGGGGR